MSKYLVITDTHFDPERSAGTTLESRADLDEFILGNLQRVLKEVEHDELIVAGDLFHKVSVSDKTISRCFNILKEEKGVILRGNHCEPSMRFGHISSLQLLCELLPNMKLVFHNPETINDHHYIPHCFDQNTFNSWIDEVPDNKFVFIHCNVDNYFSEEADHSLNISKSQLDFLREKNCKVVIGHEHAARDIESVTILGCLTPTSISDCIGGSKRCAVIDNGEISFIETWNKSDFIDVNYTELDSIGDQHFIRISGECAIEEFQKISRDISKLRAESKAFIISNNVKVKSVTKDVLSLEEVTKINVIDMLLELIPDQFKDEVKSCI